MLKPKRIALLGLLALCGAALAAGLAIGDAAPDFTLKALSGRSFQLAAHKGKAKAVVLVWVSPTCPMVHMYDRRIQALYEGLKAKGVPFYGISSDSDVTVDLWLKHHRDGHVSYPVLMDPHNKVADAYAVGCNSEAFVLDGNLKLRYHGAIDDNCRRADRVEHRFAWEAALALIAGRNPSPTQTQARGCAIERE
ncbi:MAG: redoxin domain-containing protein [Armatimonadetes bacterium]|nr:redoxin domain-containing protein [Armatimonadota bacterium]